VNYNIVIGCPRSGTTFLMNALSALPKSESLIGRILPPHIAHIMNQPISSEVANSLAMALVFSLDDHIDYIQSHRSYCVEQWFRKNLPMSELLQSLRHKRKISQLIYKEPFLAFSPRFVYETLPESKVVHIYRDGRDCANSLVRTYDVLTDEKLKSLSSAEVIFGRRHQGGLYIPWWVEAGSEDIFLSCSPYLRAVWMWKEIVKRCHTFFSRPEVERSGRVMLLKYEDLMARPEYWGKRVVEHFGGKCSTEAMKRFTSAHSRSVGNYRKRDPKEIIAANRIAADELKIYGYEND